jgi:cell division topological specificity factor
MIEFFRNMFGLRSNSGETAKERLRLVLLSDHLSLAPDLVDSLKAELLEVISRYVDIDRGNADITFEHRNSEIAMLASVPVTGVRKDVPARNGNGAHTVAAPVADAPAAVLSEPLAVEAAESLAAASEPELLPAAVPSELLAVEAVAVEAGPTDPETVAHSPQTSPAAVRTPPVQSNQAARPRRRRRRRPPAAPPATQQGENAFEDIPAGNA